MNDPTGFPRPLTLVRGGTRPDDVARLGALLADRLRERGLWAPEPSPQEPGPPGTGPAARPPRPGLGPACAGPAMDAEATGGMADGRRGAADGRLPLIVPISPAEDPAQVRADLAARLDPRGPGAAPAADLLLRTSGSTTGTGRLVAMSSAALLASARATHHRLGGPGHWVLALPAHHVAGIQVLIRSLLAGPPPEVVDTGDGFSPNALAEAVDRALAAAGPRPVHTSLVPTQLRAVLSPGQDRATAALSRAGAILLGGAAADAGLLARARAAGLGVVTTYGMSETAGGCVYDGVPLDGVEVRLQDEGRAQAAGPRPGAGHAAQRHPVEGPAAEGRICLSGPVLAEGYAERIPERRPEPASTTSHFLAEEPGAGRPWPADAAPAPSTESSTSLQASRRWLATTDRGRMETGPDGRARLVVLGRIDEVIITGGLKVEPRRVEDIMAALPGVAECCVLGLPDERWGAAVTAVVLPEPRAAEDPGLPERLRRAARQRLDGAHAPKRVILVDSLPRLGPGKIDRRALAARLGVGTAVGSPGAARSQADERTS